MRQASSLYHMNKEYLRKAYRIVGVHALARIVEVATALHRVHLILLCLLKKMYTLTQLNQDESKQIVFYARASKHHSKEISCTMAVPSCCFGVNGRRSRQQWRQR